MSLSFKLDENLPDEALNVFSQAGHRAETALGERLGGSKDQKLLEACVAEGRVLITLDLDFSDIRTYPPADHCGIWVLRPQRQSIGRVLELVAGALRLVDIEPVAQRLWIVESDRVRIRE